MKEISKIDEIKNYTYSTCYSLIFIIPSDCIRSNDVFFAIIIIISSNYSSNLLQFKTEKGYEITRNKV